MIFPECSKIANKRIDRSVSIIDLKGVSLFKIFTGKFKKFLKIGIGITQDYYPEIMGKMYIINAGYIFAGIWAVVSLWIDPVSKKKISIIKGSGKTELLEIIDADKLPVELGG